MIAFRPALLRRSYRARALRRLCTIPNGARTPASVPLIGRGVRTEPGTELTGWWLPKQKQINQKKVNSNTSEAEAMPLGELRSRTSHCPNQRVPTASGPSNVKSNTSAP